MASGPVNKVKWPEVRCADLQLMHNVTVADFAGEWSYAILMTSVALPDPGFPQALEIMENLENHGKKFHAWKNHEIWKNPE